jgi:hypothetical protein
MKLMGRPPIFATPQEMQEAIDDYFASCVPVFARDDEGEIAYHKGNPIVIDINSPTISGLAYHLGFESRQSFYDYENKDNFSYTIKRARLRIETLHEKNLSNPMIKPTGSIFWLKNAGWKDRQDINLTGDMPDEISEKINQIRAKYNDKK